MKNSNNSFTTQDKTYLFESAPIMKAILSLVIPTVISQLVHVLYNMADVFFIGQCQNPNMVAAANICTPLFIVINAIANLFGIGGASLISRCLGAGNKEKASHVSAFCFWSAFVLAGIYGIILYSFTPTLLPKFGANADTYEFCRQYLFWVVGFGSIPTALNAVCSHLVRAEGYAKQASFGLVLGTSLNIVLDPIFIFVFNTGIRGAAIATMLSNTIATLFFVILILSKKTSVLKLNPKFYSLKDRIPRDVILVGLPSAALSTMASISYIVLNRLMSSYCNEAVAGVGIAKKIDNIAFSISLGMSQGVVPLLGYNYAAHNYDRLKKIIKTTFALCVSTATVIAIALFTCASPIVKVFINDPTTVMYGQKFQKILCFTGPFIAASLLIMSIFQSIGKKVEPLILSMLRKGALDIPSMIILNAIYGINGVVWGTPLADILGAIVSIILFIPTYKKLNSELSLK